MKHVYNESENLIESYAVHFDINGPSNLNEMVSVIGMEDVVSHASVRDTWRQTYITRADSRLAPSQWETSLQSNAVSHWLGANL